MRTIDASAAGCKLANKGGHAGAPRKWQVNPGLLGRRGPPGRPENRHVATAADTMQPKTLALIDDDREYTELLAQFLRERGIDVAVFADSNELLADARAFGHDFYVVDLTLPGVDGVELIRILRRRTDAGLIVVSGRLGPNVFKSVISAGADMHVVKPVAFEEIALAIDAVHRRVGRAAASGQSWTLDRRAGELLAPDGAKVSLSETDRIVLECFVEAGGDTVSREALLQRIGRDTGAEADDGLNATIYRLRRRIERATPALVPLQSKSRVGYVFRAPLLAV
jgi:two-component system, OmpR family, response regulator